MAHASTQDSEWRTRKRLIDPRLQAAGWKGVTYDPSHPSGKGGPVAIAELPTDNGPADYALCLDDQLPITATSLSRSPWRPFGPSGGGFDGRHGAYHETIDKLTDATSRWGTAQMRLFSASRKVVTRRAIHPYRHLEAPKFAGRWGQRQDGFTAERDLRYHESTLEIVL